MEKKQIESPIVSVIENIRVICTRWKGLNHRQQASWHWQRHSNQ